MFASKIISPRQETIRLAEKISALTTESYLEERAKRGSQLKFWQALAKVPDVEPEGFDRL